MNGLKKNPRTLPIWQQIALGLVLGGGVVALLVWNDSHRPGDKVAAQTLTPNERLAAAQRPEQQLRFCAIIDAAAVAYAPQNAAWYAEKNAIVWDRMTPKLAAMRDERDRAVLNHLGAKNPKMDGWIVHMVGLSTGIGRSNIATLTLTARCTALVTLGSEVEMTPAQADVLASIKPGGYLRVSGIFIGHDAGVNTPARALDWDAFEKSAMETPSYQFVLTAVSAE